MTKQVRSQTEKLALLAGLSELIARAPEGIALATLSILTEGDNTESLQTLLSGIDAIFGIGHATIRAILDDNEPPSFDPAKWLRPKNDVM